MSYISLGGHFIGVTVTFFFFTWIRSRDEYSFSFQIGLGEAIFGGEIGVYTQNYQR